MKNISFIVFCFFCFFCFASYGYGHSAEKCTRQDAMRAEEEASVLQKWDEIYLSYKRFKQCDDGAIAEGYSSSIQDMFLKEWTSSRELFSLIKRDAGFLDFIKSHIDDMMSLDTLLKIKKDAKFSCPQDDRGICDEIIISVDDILHFIETTERN